jgi:hypothetical protein
VVAANVLAGFEVVLGTAIGALGLARFGHIQVHLGMAAPKGHVGFGAGAKHAAMAMEVFGQEFN